MVPPAKRSPLRGRPAGGRMIGKDLRLLIPAAMDHVYLNTAMMGPTPTPALTAAAAAEMEWQEVGPGHLPFYEGARDEAERFRERLEHLFPEGRVNLAVTHREALLKVLFGLELGAEDEMVVVDGEDSSMLEPVAEAAARFRARVRVLSLSDGDLCGQLERVLSARTRLVAVSHVSPETGWELPVAAIAERVHAFPRCRLLVDGAQAWGNVALDVAATGADFYVLLGHKWLLAPPPAAALWIRQSRVGDLLTVLPRESRERRLERLRHGDWSGIRTSPSAPSTQPWPRLVGWALCLDYFEEEGFQGHEAYRNRLADQLREGIGQIPRLGILDPPTRDLRPTALVVISLPSPRRRTVEALWRQNLFVHPTEAGVRVSLASFNVSEDVDRLLQGLAELS